MSESRSHKDAKSKAPGKSEVPIRGGRRLDSATKKTATEVERHAGRISQAVSRLKASGRQRKVLHVPHHHMADAAAEFRRQNVSGTVKNLGGTNKRSVSKKK